MTTGRPKSLQDAVDRAYASFASQPAGGDFCRLCWDAEEIASLRKAPVRQISAELARRLMWETADHFESSEVYRHYLPRILDALAPPNAIEDLYPLHLSETLVGQAFRFWSAEERHAVYEFLDAVTPCLDFDQPRGQEEWKKGLLDLRRPTELFQLPPPN